MNELELGVGIVTTKDNDYDIRLLTAINAELNAKINTLEVKLSKYEGSKNA